MNKIRAVIFLATFAIVTACGCTRKQEPQEVKLERYTEDLTIYSEILGRNISYSITIPESYYENRNQRYPVVYMLHGLGDDHHSWNGKYLHANNKISALESKGQISEMIYVYPFGLTTYYCNYYTGKYNFMDMLVEEFIPAIDSLYRTIPDKQHRAITGYSMGGFGAMVLPEKHPELFCCSAPLSMSFRTDAQYGSESQSGWEEQWGKIFGGIAKSGADRLTDYYKEHCPFYQFTPQNREKLSSVKWFYTCGDDEEQLLVANDSLHVLLRDNGYQHEFRVANGAHTSSYWMEALDEVLPWFDCQMNGGSAWPECSRISYTVPTVTFAEDGTLPSVAYASEQEGTAVFFFHNGLPQKEVQDVMAMFSTENTKTKYIFLPCDLSKKSISEWNVEYGGKYMFDGCYAVALEGTGATVWSNSASFTTMVLIDTTFDEKAEAAYGKNYYFACTDDSACYRDMGSLYRSCKRNGNKFEYRVINASSDKAADRLRCAFKLKNAISY